MAFHQPLQAAGGMDTSIQTREAKSYTRPFAGVLEVGQTLLMQFEGLIMIALQPGRGPQTGEGTADTCEVINILEQGQTLRVKRSRPFVVTVGQGATS